MVNKIKTFKGSSFSIEKDVNSFIAEKTLANDEFEVIDFDIKPLTGFGFFLLIGSGSSEQCLATLRYDE